MSQFPIFGSLLPAFSQQGTFASHCANPSQLLSRLGLAHLKHEQGGFEHLDREFFQLADDFFGAGPDLGGRRRGWSSILIACHAVARRSHLKMLLLHGFGKRWLRDGKDMGFPPHIYMCNQSCFIAEENAVGPVGLVFLSPDAVVEDGRLGVAALGDGIGKDP